MEVCTDPLAPEYWGGAGIAVVVAVYTGSIPGGIVAGGFTYLCISLLKDLMERFLNSAPEGTSA